MNPVSGTNYTGRIVGKENHYRWSYHIPLHNCIPFHNSNEKHRCGENHLLKKGRPYRPVHWKLSMRDEDQQRQPMPTNRGRRCHEYRLYHYYPLHFLPASPRHPRYRYFHQQPLLFFGESVAGEFPLCPHFCICHECPGKQKYNHPWPVLPGKALYKYYSSHLLKRHRAYAGSIWEALRLNAQGRE